MAVHYVHSQDQAQCCMGDTAANTPPRHTSFILHYAARGAKNKWKHRTVTMNHTDPRQVASWVKTIRNYLAGLKNRPKRLLLFVNPFGGKRKGLKIYEKQVKPLLLVAGVEANMIVTQRQNHARDVILNCSFDNVDGIACIGGDGTFAEVFNGLVLRTAKDSGVDYNDPDARIPPPSLRVGVIPGGSTDTMAYCFHGTTDVQTAILHIILDDLPETNVLPLTSESELQFVLLKVTEYINIGLILNISARYQWIYINKKAFRTSKSGLKPR
ncbi:hypothetical protein L9F63_021739, partial [Diploptera punctata]